MIGLKLIVAANLLLLLAACPAPAADEPTAVSKTAAQLSAEIADLYGLGGQLPSQYLKPRAEMPYRMVTPVGVPCPLEYNFVGGTAPVACFAWDFESDGIIDWASRYQMPVKHTYPRVGNYCATFYVFDVLGQYGLAEIPIEVRPGRGEPKREKHALKLSLKGLDKHEHRQSREGLPDSRQFCLLIADQDDFLWHPVVQAYHRLVDSLGYDGDDIIVVAGGDLGLTRYYYSFLEDTVIIDYRYTPDGMDSAFNYLLENMTGNDDLHVISSAHGGGQLDSSVSNYTGTHGAYQFVSGRIFSDEKDPDLFELEENFKLAIPYWWHGFWAGNRSVGLNEWSYNPYRGYQGWCREKRVATFEGVTFINTDKTADDDFYIETIVQYLMGDANHNGMIDYGLGEVFDWDGDGRYPAYIENDSLVFDEDDWGDFALSVDNSDTAWVNSHYLMIDEGFDGKADMCFECWNHFPVPFVHGTDLDNDGILDRFDANGDGDFLDSIGVDEAGFKGLDNDVAEFLDSLDYRYVTFILQNCFSGGFINDLSRKDVLIATSTSENALVYGTGFELLMFRNLTGGAYPYQAFEPADDRVVTFFEAYNEACRDRNLLDDNGDGVGHFCPLPSEGDGYLAAELNWGTLLPHMPLAVHISPADGETLFENLTPTFVWSDSIASDSFQMTVTSSPCSCIVYDTVFTLPDSCRPTWIPADLYWRVRSFKDGREGGWPLGNKFFLSCDFHCCEGMRGNVDGDPDDVVDAVDLMWLSEFVYNYGRQPPCFPEANVDGGPGYNNEMPDSLDVKYLSDYLYHGGPPPATCR
ncbi:MAG: hypothetical protein JSW34_02595 [Candidatus Zixiibacteriota bacterium]|nr:MAG: hypothetical protein JSW34_02595 [candidate division Zixibacteria bacterium]